MDTSSVSTVRPEILLQEEADGSLCLRTPDMLGQIPARVTERLEHWARATPDHPFLAGRVTHGWRGMSYAETRGATRSITQALLDRSLDPAQPVLVLSGNGIEHALLALACLHVGVIFCPTSTAYSLASQDFTHLRDIVDLVRPSMVFADDGDRYGPALRACIPQETEIVLASGDAGRPATGFNELIAMTATPAVDIAAASVDADRVAKLLFTSGSIGFPKGVITTHRTIASTICMLSARCLLPIEGAPVLVDWLPWNHILGGTCSFGLALFHGGTLHIDEGRPLPGQIEQTVRNLREVSPQIYLNVPKGYEELVPWLRRDRALRENFFSRVRMLMYSGASMSQRVCDAIDELALTTIGRRVPWLSVLGSTEAGPIATYQHADGAPVGRVGLPPPGVTLKLAPMDGKWEARLRSPSVTPGYWRNDAITATAFDEGGFFRTGDALDWIDRENPSAGLRYDGRIAEDFKLATGTWIRVGQLKAHILRHLAPEVRDLVIVGENRDYIAVLGIPSAEDTVTDSVARARLIEKLKKLAAEATGSAQRVQRFAFLTAKLSIDAGEVTDKGVLNQRMIARRYSGLVEMLYSEPPPEGVILAFR